MPKMRSRLKASERATLRDISNANFALQGDERRRLRNAVRALSCDDPSFLYWLEQNIPAHDIDREHLQLIEIRARTLVTRGYKHLFSAQQRLNIIYSNMPFGDNGALQQI